MTKTVLGFELAVAGEVLHHRHAAEFDAVNAAIAEDPNPVILEMSFFTTTFHALHPDLSLSVEQRPSDGFIKIPIPDRSTWRAFHRRDMRQPDTTQVNPVSSFMNLTRGFLSHSLYPDLHFKKAVLTSPNEVETHFAAAQEQRVSPHQGLVVGSSAVACFAALTLEQEQGTDAANAITSRSFAQWVFMQRIGTLATLSPVDTSQVAGWRDTLVDRTALDLSQIVNITPKGVIFDPQGETAWLTSSSIDLFDIQTDEQAAILKKGQGLATARFSKRKRALIGAAAKVEYGFDVPLEAPAGYAKNGKVNLETSIQNLVENLSGQPYHDNSVTFEYGLPVLDIRAIAAQPRGGSERTAKIWTQVVGSIDETVKTHRFSEYDYAQLRRAADYALALATVDFGMPEAFTQSRVTL